MKVFKHNRNGHYCPYQDKVKKGTENGAKKRELSQERQNNGYNSEFSKLHIILKKLDVIIIQPNPQIFIHGRFICSI